MRIKSLLIVLFCLCLPALAQDKPLPKDIPALQVLAEKGDAKAQLMLASKYYFGRGVPKDLRAAAGWYGKAAAQGNAEGQYSMGLMYWRGEGVMGLRRAFIQAGTKNLLMTLWPVSDALTVNVMKGFYEKAMIGKGDAPKALAEVQRDVLVYLRKVPKFNRENIGTKKAVDLAGPFVLSFQNN